MMEMRATPQLEGAKPVHDFEYNLGGRQDGSEDATVFADMLETNMSPVVHSWHQRGLGFKVDNVVLSTHWALGRKHIHHSL